MSFLINPFAFAVAGGDFESIATVTVGSGGAASVEFTSIPSTYQHLQIRAILAKTSASSVDDTLWRWNGDTTVANYYTLHQLKGNGSAASAAAFNPGEAYSRLGVHASNASYFSAVVVDILDYASTTKNKTMRAFFGYDQNGSGEVFLRSSLWMNTAALSSITISTNGGTVAQHSTFALYGVKAP
jgi:hypothetical protein